MLPKAGGFPVYLNAAFHPVVGFMSGFQSWLIGSPGSLSAGALAIVAIFGWEGITGKIIATAILAVFTVINTQGVKTGALIQNVMYYLPSADREVLISGLCYECQDEMFHCPEDEDDDEPDDIDDDCGFDPYEGCFTYDC
jgi:hypothetical protein